MTKPDLYSRKSETMMRDLKLVALDADDLQVISSCCQDAVLKVGDLDYLAADGRFVLVMNRFAWETRNDAGTQNERRRSVLHFDRVSGVKVSGINRAAKDTVLSLLAILFEVGDEPAGTVELVFAGDGGIRLQVECIEAQMSDLPGRWEAKSVPSHEQE
jgi:hypothetical protein